MRNRTRDLSACSSIVPQPTTLPRALKQVSKIEHSFIIYVNLIWAERETLELLSSYP
jgi:hypothetical protein